MPDYLRPYARHYTKEPVQGWSLSTKVCSRKTSSWHAYATSLGTRMERLIQLVFKGLGRSYFILRDLGSSTLVWKHLGILSVFSLPPFCAASTHNPHYHHPSGQQTESAMSPLTGINLQGLALRSLPVKSICRSCAWPKDRCQGYKISILILNHDLAMNSKFSNLVDPEDAKWWMSFC